MPNINSPRIQRWMIQEQTAVGSFKNTSGTWDNAGAQLIRVDQGSVALSRNAPYSRFPVIVGGRSELAGIRGRKLASWSIRGMPVIPSGAAGTAPDMALILKNLFGAAGTVVSSTSVTYSFNDTGKYPMSLFGFAHGVSTLTQRAAWGLFVSRAVFNFNGPFLTVDLEGFAGYMIDNIGFSVFDALAKAGLTTFPTEVSTPTVTGSPIAGFGSGYTCTVHSQDISLKVRALSLTYESGWTPVADVYGSPYLIDVIGDTRRVSLSLGNALDDDTAALNDLKVQCDTDNVVMNATIVAGVTAGSIVTFNVNNIQPNAFNLRDSGPEVSFELPTSYAHTSSPSVLDDSTIVFT